VTTLVARYEQVNTNTLVSKVTPGSRPTQDLLESLRGLFISRGFDAAGATHRAYISVFGMVEREAMMLSFNQVFWLLAVLFLAVMPLVFLMSRPAHRGSNIEMH
jgi:DHA2 family multidrug resistance protein